MFLSWCISKNAFATKQHESTLQELDVYRIIINEAYDRGREQTIRAHDREGQGRDVESFQEVVSFKVNLGGTNHFQAEEKRKDHPNGGGSSCKCEKGK